MEMLTGQQPSALRQRFAAAPGTFISRAIGLERTDREIRNLHERPYYSPMINIVEVKALGSAEDDVMIFSEVIHGNMEFLIVFEKFIRANLVKVPAVNFDQVPAEYQEYYHTPYDTLTCDVDRRVESVIPHRDGPIVVEKDHLLGVDTKVPVNLGLVPPKVLSDRLGEIERIAIFRATVHKPNGNFNTVDEILYQESRHGTERKTWCHSLVSRDGISIL